MHYHVLDNEKLQERKTMNYDTEILMQPSIRSCRLHKSFPKRLQALLSLLKVSR